ncbi:MAG: HlyD family type I secretion periplasmic adaptor subunit [Pseudomonadales bacterium]|nr:HlyD family type I secretion periplasmic adaptor subunit [Halioglobus sp.]MCP5130466.1 HlyD family type I secretion periplasmic adaptor subunit [Pseudomonadales bacterium]
MSARVDNAGDSALSVWSRLRSSLGAGGERASLQRERRRFLPAALEVQESPPSPAGRWLLALLLSLFTIGIVWAWFGEVDIVVSAPGRIIPSGHVKLIQAPEAGTVVAILAREGATVAAGQPLIRLDSTYADADDLRIREQLHDLALESSWRRALDQWLADGLLSALEPSLSQRFAAMDQAKAEALYRMHRQEIQARILGLERELAANRAEQVTLQAEHERTRATLDVLAQRVTAYKTLLDQQYGAKIQYLEMLQQQTELERSLPVLESRLQQLRETASALAARSEATLDEIRKQNLLALARLDTQRAVLQQDSHKASKRRQQLVIVAPVAGNVQELAVHTVGAVVSPAQVLMKIVPGKAAIEVEALLQNRDVGFVHEGQLAEVKVDAFNFTKYGLIDAELVNISNDAVEDKQLGWVFKLRLELENETIAVEDKLVKLSPGMGITAEIRTGKRRLIEFFLSPLLKYKQESIRER